jgi:hypothetical protein
MLRDVTAMRHVFATVPVLDGKQAKLRSLALDRFWVKPGRHCHAAYRLTLDTERGPVETLGSATLLGDAGRGPDLLRRARELPPARAPWEPRAAAALVESPRALLQLFPWDARLPTLARALDPDHVAAALGTEVHAGVPVGYWPGMRCQVRYETAEGPLFGKVFPDAAGAGVAKLLERVAATLADAAGVAVPSLRAWVPSLHLLVTTPLDGTALIERLEHGAPPETVVPVATALARLHAVELSHVDRRFRPADDLEVVRPWVAFATETFPALGPDLAAALARLETALPAGERPATLVHRDFYDKQVLVGASRVGLLDLDTLCHGDPEIDVANFGAHLTLRGLQWHASPDALAPLAAAFADAYRRQRPDLDRRRVDWYRASTLLRLACLYALRPWWEEITPRLVEESHRALA